MPDFTKLAAYLNSFDKSSSSYDLVCFLKTKIADDFNDSSTVNNGEDDNLEDNDITMTTPGQQASSNTEGEIMGGAFKELDALNQIDEEKTQISVDTGKSESRKAVNSTQSFGDNSQNQKQASLYSQLLKKYKLNAHHDRR